MFAVKRKKEILYDGLGFTVCSCCVWASVGVDCEMLPPSRWEEGERVLLCVGKPLKMAGGMGCGVKAVNWQCDGG